MEDNKKFLIYSVSIIFFIFLTMLFINIMLEDNCNKKYINFICNYNVTCVKKCKELCKYCSLIFKKFDFLKC